MTNTQKTFQDLDLDLDFEEKSPVVQSVKNTTETPAPAYTREMFLREIRLRELSARVPKTSKVDINLDFSRDEFLHERRVRELSAAPQKPSEVHIELNLGDDTLAEETLKNTTETLQVQTPPLADNIQNFLRELSELAEQDPEVDIHRTFANLKNRLPNAKNISPAQRETIKSTPPLYSTQTNAPPIKVARETANTFSLPRNRNSFFSQTFKSISKATNSVINQLRGLPKLAMLSTSVNTDQQGTDKMPDLSPAIKKAKKSALNGSTPSQVAQREKEVIATQPNLSPPGSYTKENIKTGKTHTAQTKTIADHPKMLFGKALKYISEAINNTVEQLSKSYRLALPTLVGVGAVAVSASAAFAPVSEGSTSEAFNDTQRTISSDDYNKYRNDSIPTEFKDSYEVEFNTSSQQVNHVSSARPMIIYEDLTPPQVPDVTVSDIPDFCQVIKLGYESSTRHNANTSHFNKCFNPDSSAYAKDGYSVPLAANGPAFELIFLDETGCNATVITSLRPNTTQDVHGRNLSEINYKIPKQLCNETKFSY